MKALTVSINGRRIYTAGIGSNGVLGTYLGWAAGRAQSAPEGRFFLMTAGLNSDTRQHLRWRAPSLGLGDSVSVEVVEAEIVDPQSVDGPCEESWWATLVRELARSTNTFLFSLRRDPRGCLRDRAISLQRLVSSLPSAVRWYVFESPPDAALACFVVSLNGSRLCTAAVSAPGVLTTAVTWSAGGGVSGPNGRIDLTVGGLDSRKREHLRWHAPKLRVGDRVAIDIGHTRTPDPPLERYPSKDRGASLRERMRRAWKRG